MIKPLVFIFLLVSSFNIATASMQDMDHKMHHKMHHESMHSAKMHGPIGLMGDHFHKKGESMVSIRYMKMSMNQNYLGSSKISDLDIIQLPNPSGMPKNLSVVPQEMEMDMVMLGSMYAPSDSITLMGMAMFNLKEMDLKTYQPMMNRNVLGQFSTRSSGLSTINISALFKIYDSNGSKLHAQLGIQKDMGKNDLQGQALTPMGTYNSIFLPYGMQIGDKSNAALSAITYTKTFGLWKIGGQLKSKLNIESDLWNFGDSYEANLWTQRDINNKSAWSLRLKFQDIQPVDGFNQNINAPVQTANPLNYGGQIIDLGVGINIMLSRGSIGLEAYRPISNDLNGPQMGMNWGMQAGYHLSF